MTFFGEFRGTHEQEHHLHESPPSMSLVLVVLGVLSMIGGFVMLPEFIAEFKPFERFLEPVFSSGATREIMEAALKDHTTEAGVGGIAFVMVVAGWLLADLIYRRRTVSAERFSELWGGVLYRLVYNKYHVDEIYDAIVVQPYLALTRAAAWFDANIIDGIVNFAGALTVFGSWLSGLFDNYIVDGLVNYLSNLTLTTGGRMRRLQTGSINGYLYGILAAVMLILLARAMLRA
jgi:NADH-quinone oxidoreductase subunit L